MSNDSLSDFISFLFPFEIWSVVGSSITGFVLAVMMLTGIYLVILYLEKTWHLPGAWNPWVIFWGLMLNFLLVLLLAWWFGPFDFFGIEFLSTTPNTCVGNKGSLEGGLCYENCRDGYHGFGVRCYANTYGIGVGTVIGLEPCPEETDGQGGWTNLGLTCSRWKRECVKWGPLFGATWWTGCVETVGRLDKGGLCPGPQDFSGNYDEEIKKWKKANDKPDPIRNPQTGEMETEAEAKAAGHKTCEDIEIVGKDKHTERIDGLCYKKCPSDYPNHVPGMPYLCYKGGDLSYHRGGGSAPPLFRILKKYAIGNLFG
jgi:hypothetical protein